MDHHSRVRDGRLFVIACSFGIAIGVVATAGMLLAATAFATASNVGGPARSHVRRLSRRGRHRCGHRHRILGIQAH